MGLCISLVKRLALCFKKRGAEYEKLESQVQMAGSPLIALTGKDDNANDNGKASGTGADTDVDEEDPDFADWDETSKSNTNQTHTTNQTQLQTSTHSHPIDHAPLLTRLLMTLHNLLPSRISLIHSECK